MGTRQTLAAFLQSSGMVKLVFPHRMAKNPLYLHPSRLSKDFLPYPKSMEVLLPLVRGHVLFPIHVYSPFVHILCPIHSHSLSHSFAFFVPFIHVHAHLMSLCQAHGCDKGFAVEARTTIP